MSVQFYIPGTVYDTGGGYRASVEIFRICKPVTPAGNETLD